MNTTTTTLTIEQRRALCLADVTLNGRPAQVCGAKHDFAWVKTFDLELQAEWSWDAVIHIIANNNGEFHL